MFGEEINAKTQGRKDAKVVDLPQRSGCSVLARRAGTSIWGMTVCGLSNPVYRPSGPLGLYYAPGNRGLRPRQRIYQPSGLRTARSGSPVEIRLGSGSPAEIRLFVVDLLQRSWRFGLWRLEHLEGPSSLDATNCHQTMLQCAFPADSKESCR